MKKIKKPIAIRFGLENVECIDFQIDAFKTFSICENALCHCYYEGEHEITDSFGGGYFRIKKEFNYKLEGEYYNENSTTTAFDRLMQFNDITDITIYYPSKKVEIYPWIEDEEYYYTCAAGNTDQSSIIDKETGDLIIILKGSMKPDLLEESVSNSQKDPFNGSDGVVFEDGCLLPDDDAKDYKVTDFLIF
jgi:hypothetical protein